ncbi:hypothetical protein P692DRAFT_201808494 [Suillus brevipes Sb2]|nr:hypothetical protein P692DRAFT_201808494 [Suillus brevipes Sb2]
MKRLFFTTALALAQAFVVLSQHAETAFHVSSSCNGPCQVSSACEEHARQAGLPMDGWEIVYGDDGQPKCRRTVVQELCYGTQYRDACCAKDHAWTYDNGGSSGRGGCCPVGFHMRNGTCVPHIPDPPYHPDPPLPALRHVAMDMAVSNPRACARIPNHGHRKYLGRKYVHVIAKTRAEESRKTDKSRPPVHVSRFSGGREQTLPSTEDMFDGADRSSVQTEWWIDDAFGGNHMKFTLDANHAGKFTGIPTCAGGECALQLYGGPTGGALAFACPMPNPGLTFYGNPKVGQKLRFSEVTCDEYEVPLTSGINLH